MVPRLRKLSSNAWIQKKILLGIPGLPSATRCTRNALEMTTRYSRNALEMTASLVFAKSKATLIQDQAEPSAEPSEIAIHYTVNEVWNQVEPSGTKRTC